MFENLKTQRRGFGPKERTRLVVTVAALLVLGAMIWGGQTFYSAPPPRALPVAAHDEQPKPSLHELDPVPLEGIRASGGGDPRAFDVKALDYVLREVQGGLLRREPQILADGPAQVLALDPKEAVGKMVEVVGTVRSLDKEAYPAHDNPTIDQLWAFELEGKDGARIAVVHGGLSSDPDGDKPADAYHPLSAPQRLEDGNLVRVRGIYLQRRTGALGRLTLDAPTPVLVGREYRLTVPPPPPPATIADADWIHVKDRTLGQTRRVDDDAHYQLLLWARAKGHDAIARDLKSGALPTRFWGRDEFYRWRNELEKDKDTEAPDPRTWTQEIRGQVFETTGVLGDYLKEDWDAIDHNFYDVGVRWKYWIVSDFYANALLMMDSAFPLEDFPGVQPPEAKSRQKVRAYGIFVRNFSYRPKDAAARPDRPGEITVPYFLLLHLEPDVPYRSGPLTSNPFFWAWVSLAAFGLLFFVVMSRLEKKETAMIQEKHRKIRLTLRSHQAKPGTGPAGPGSTGGGTPEKPAEGAP